MIFIRKLHKWLGLVIFIQVVLWTVSGLMFSWLNHHEVAAEHGVHPPVAQPLAHSQLLAEPATWLDQYADREIREIRLVSVLDRWFWRIEAAGQVELRDAEGGTRVRLDEAFVQRMAREYYKGKGQTTPTVEYLTGSSKTYAFKKSFVAVLSQPIPGH